MLGATPGSTKGRRQGHKEEKPLTAAQGVSPSSRQPAGSCWAPEGTREAGLQPGSHPAWAWRPTLQQCAAACSGGGVLRNLGSRPWAGHLTVRRARAVRPQGLCVQQRTGAPHPV